ASLSDIYSKVYLYDGRGANLILTTKHVAVPLYGGKGYISSANEIDRVREVTHENFLTGDMLIISDAIDCTHLRAYLYLGDGVFATVKDGKYVKYSPFYGQTLLESLMSCYSFCVCRPSFQF
ncbi:MAG: hypothetical protein IJS65_02550, partial [Clostridia bacterium]|nr:hypothetical protein [Clostridia bacterium]